MTKILAVFGATGQQGFSIIDYVHGHEKFSGQYSLRAITRDINSDKAKRLKARGIEVVQADLDDPASLEPALTGAHTVFAMTMPTLQEGGFEKEYGHGKILIDAAIRKGASYIIFSTLPAASDISNGKYVKCDHFNAKAAIEKYLRSKPVKSAFYMPGAFMQNFSRFPAYMPQKRASQDSIFWEISVNMSPHAKIPLVDIVGDTGKFVGAILLDPEAHEGKTIHGASSLYTWEEIAAIIAKATGKAVVYRQHATPEQDLDLWQQILFDSYKFQEEFQYYGPNTEQIINEAVANACESPSTFEQYLVAHPLALT